MNERALGRGMKLRDGNGRGWGNKIVLYAYDAVLKGEAREHLQHIVNEFEWAFDIIGLKLV